MNPKALREKIKTLRRDLSAVHRSLLHYQLRIQESLDERRYSSGDLLQLSIQSEDFAWLRSLSTTIAFIDETVDEELIEEVVELRTQILNQLQPMFAYSEEPVGFASRLAMASAQDPSVVLEVAAVRKSLAALKA